MTWTEPTPPLLSEYERFIPCYTVTCVQFGFDSRAEYVLQFTLQSIDFISAELTFPGTLPKCLTYATRVSGWFVMYMQRNVDLEATGSDMALLVQNCERKR